MNGLVDHVVELYFKGCTIEKAVKSVKGEIKKEILEKMIENYEGKRLQAKEEGGRT